MSLLIVSDRSQPLGWGVQWEFHYTLPSSIYHLGTLIKTNHVDARATSTPCIPNQIGSVFSMNDLLQHIYLQKCPIVSIRVSDSGKSHFIGIWVSLHPWSTVSLLCICYIPYALCKAWVKVILLVSPAAYDTQCKWLWPLKYRSHWTGGNQQSTTSEGESIILLVHIPIKPKTERSFL